MRKECAGETLLMAFHVADGFLRTGAHVSWNVVKEFLCQEYGAFHIYFVSYYISGQLNMTSELGLLLTVAT